MVPDLAIEIAASTLNTDLKIGSGKKVAKDQDFVEKLYKTLFTKLYL